MLLTLAPALAFTRHTFYSMIVRSGRSFCFKALAKNFSKQLPQLMTVSHCHSKMIEHVANLLLAKELLTNKSRYLNLSPLLQARKMSSNQITIDRCGVVCCAMHNHMNTKIYSKGGFVNRTKISTNKNFPLYGMCPCKICSVANLSTLLGFSHHVEYAQE